MLRKFQQDLVELSLFNAALGRNTATQDVQVAHAEIRDLAQDRVIDVGDGRQRGFNLAEGEVRLVHSDNFGSRRS